MTAVTEQMLDEMVQVIVRAFDPDQVYLFGSRARKTSHQDSDIDLLIVDNQPFGPEHSRFQEINRVYQVPSSFRIPVDVLLYSSEEFAKWKHSLNHVPKAWCGLWLNMTASKTTWAKRVSGAF